jgi:hypothetical protein
MGRDPATRPAQHNTLSHWLDDQLLSPRARAILVRPVRGFFLLLIAATVCSCVEQRTIPAPAAGSGSFLLAAVKGDSMEITGGDLPHGLPVLGDLGDYGALYFLELACSAETYRLPAYFGEYDPLAMEPLELSTEFLRAAQVALIDDGEVGAWMPANEAPSPLVRTLKSAVQNFRTRSCGGFVMQTLPVRVTTEVRFAFGVGSAIVIGTELGVEVARVGSSGAGPPEPLSIPEPPSDENFVGGSGFVENGREMIRLVDYEGNVLEGELGGALAWSSHGPQNPLRSRELASVTGSERALFQIRRDRFLDMYEPERGWTLLSEIPPMNGTTANRVRAAYSQKENDAIGMVSGLLGFNQIWRVTLDGVAEQMTYAQDQLTLNAIKTDEEGRVIAATEAGLFRRETTRLELDRWFEIVVNGDLNDFELKDGAVFYVDASRTIGLYDPAIGERFDCFSFDDPMVPESARITRHESGLIVTHLTPPLEMGHGVHFIHRGGSACGATP